MRMHRFFYIEGGSMEEKRLAVIGITVEKADSAMEVNHILHDYGEYIIGRIGVPYQNRQMSVITIILDAPQNLVSSLSGKLGMLTGIYAKTMYLKVGEE